MGYREYMVREEPTGRSVPPMVARLLWINGGVFLAHHFLLRGLLMPLTNYFALSRVGLQHGFFWQPATYLFLHANFAHLAWNMLGLYFMGPDTERALGGSRFLGLYFLSGVLGGIGFVLLNPLNPTIGASGAVYGVLAAFAALYPNRRVTLLLFPFITFRAWFLALAFGTMEFLSVLTSEHGGGIAHSAHLAGGIAGWIYARTLVANPILPFLRGFRFRSGGPARPDPRPDAETIDRILDKIAAHGLHSLSSRERDLLDRASRDRTARG